MELLPSFTPLQSWGAELPVQYSSDIAVVFIVVFSIVMVMIGIVASRYQTNEEEYFAAGRRGGILVIALSGFAAIQSGWGIVGGPGTIYQLGTEYFAMSIFIPAGFVLAYWLLARKMRLLGGVKNAITAPDAMYYRFPDDRIRLLGAISVFLGSMGYLAAQYAALGIIGALILPVGFIEALILGLIVVGFYTIVGGVLAAIWSDAVQGAMMIIGGVLTSYYLFTGYPGGVAGMTQSIQTQVPAFFNFSILGQEALTAIGFPISAFLIPLTIAGQPHFTTKFYMTKNVSILRWGAIIAGGGYLITTLYWWAGPIMRALVLQGQYGGELPTADAALPLALIEFAPAAVTAFVLTAIIAAIMSTSNAFLNVGAAAIVHDFLIEYRGMELSDKQQVRYGQVTTAAILLAAFIMAASFPGLIFVLGSAGWAIFAAVLIPCVAVAYNWKGATTEGALWGGGVGLGLTLLLAYLPSYLGFSLPLNFLGGQLAQIIGFFVFVGVSLVTNTSEYDDLDEEIQAVMDIGRIRGGTGQPQDVAADGGKHNDD